MKLNILAAFNTNSRRLIRIWRSWGADSFKKQKTGVGMRFYLFIYFFCEKVQILKIAILPEFLLNLSPVRRWCNEIRYPRGFSY